MGGAVRHFFSRWVDAMPNTIIGLCLSGVLACLIAIASILGGSTELALAAFFIGQVGAVLALLVGFALDKRRLDRRR